VIWDVFVSHAGEDKADVARLLTDALTAAGLRVWLDENELQLGDSNRAKIDHGLAHSRSGSSPTIPSLSVELGEEGGHEPNSGSAEGSTQSFILCETLAAARTI
jgi:hypothetical protein